MKGLAKMRKIKTTILTTLVCILGVCAAFGLSACSGKTEDVSCAHVFFCVAERSSRNVRCGRRKRA